MSTHTARRAHVVAWPSHFPFTVPAAPSLLSSKSRADAVAELQLAATPAAACRRLFGMRMLLLQFVAHHRAPNATRQHHHRDRHLHPQSSSVIQLKW